MKQEWQEFPGSGERDGLPSLFHSRPGEDSIFQRPRCEQVAGDRRETMQLRRGKLRPGTGGVPGEGFPMSVLRGHRGSLSL